MSDFINVKTTIRGVRPLLMHSAAGADPLSDWAKERSKISKIRQKTEEIHMQLAKLDWYSSFYADENRKPVILGTMLEACCIGGAKRTKQGQVAKASILINENPEIQHDHPKGQKATIDDFWENAKYRDARGVIVNRARIMRYRPIFNVWEATFEAMLTELDVSSFQTILENAGRFVGLGDFRPKFGLFEVVTIKPVCTNRARHGRVRQRKARMGPVWKGRLWHSSAGSVLVGLGRAWFGKGLASWRNICGAGMLWPVVAWMGPQWHGEAW